ncbi:protein SHQ1 homolog [Sabethes cyaneus]|uniref:protein SHQ1 homolog n=1 Tax=Sabethes cyaneus TaxID=53552 RepID=UPI00237E87CB|nr:protein SHQ1 homolog [Sabethes cyaneus]
MCDKLTYSLQYTEAKAILVITAPDLDVEHEDILSLEVFDQELVFTAPPHYQRIPSKNTLVPGEVFPTNIDYEKSAITYHIPLSVEKDLNEPPQKGFNYGFGDFYDSVLNIQTTQDFKTLSNPEQFSNDERRAKRLADEQKDFNEEHYGMDCVQYMIDGFGIRPDGVPLDIQLTDEQRYQIELIMDRKKCDLNRYTWQHPDLTVLAGLVDILLATLYDKLVNSNELNEAISHFNIHRLSATLSYFEKHDSIHQVLIAFYRRCCIYPLYRSKNLALMCTRILIDALKSNDFVDWILEKLLHCYEAFKRNECTILNHYYIKDFVRFVQSTLSRDRIQDLGKEIAEFSPSVFTGSLGLGEASIALKMIKSIMDNDDDTTDSDDTDGSSTDDGTETDTSTDDEGVSDSVESVLDKLKNINLQI